MCTYIHTTHRLPTAVYLTGSNVIIPSKQGAHGSSNLVYGYHPQLKKYRVPGRND